MRHACMLTAACAVLSACGGSGSGNDGVPGDGAAIRRFEEQSRALDAQVARLADLDFTATLPASGSATYGGHIGATADFGAGGLVFVTAAVDLTARFGGGTISGSYSGASSADGSVSGSGVFTGGSIGPAGISSPVSGTLARDGVVHDLEGELRGAFLGPAAQGIAGAIEAELRRGGVSSGRFDGELWAEN